MPIPDYQSLMLPVLTIAAVGEIRIGEAVDRLAEQFALTSDERAQLLPSGKQTLFGNRVHWAKTYLTKAGLLESTRRGHFQITKRGRQVIAAQPPRIDNDFLNQFAEFRQFKEKSAQGAGQEPSRTEAVFETTHETPDEIMRAAHKQIEVALAQRHQTGKQARAEILAMMLTTEALCDAIADGDVEALDVREAEMFKVLIESL
jgi:restriction system protein